VPHIGTPYEAIATDALARFSGSTARMYFSDWNDEHGLKMAADRRARKAADAGGRDPATRSDSRKDERLNVSLTDSIRTTKNSTIAPARKSGSAWRTMATFNLDSIRLVSVPRRGLLRRGRNRVGRRHVRLGPQRTPVEWVEEKSYFFKLSAYQDRLLALYASQPTSSGPDSRKNEVVSFVKADCGICRSRGTTFDGGVKVPGPRACMYVWVDALTNYITGVGFPDESDPNWRLLAGRRSYHRQGHHPFFTRCTGRRS